MHAVWYFGYTCITYMMHGSVLCVFLFPFLLSFASCFTFSLLLHAKFFKDEQSSTGI